MGDKALHVDWAASVVVACVNTQRRDTVIKRARAAYAWQLATSEVDPELEIHGEMVDETRQALAQLDTEIRRSFQHYAHLVRDETGVKVHLAKFDDDTKSALNGNDVWAALAGTGDAVRTGGELAGSYLHQLLDLSTRNFSLSEVVEKFWRDPAFPLIPSDSVARRAIFDALRPDDDGLAWELVTAYDEPLAVASPEQLLLNSTAQYVRTAKPSVPHGEPTATPGPQPEAPGGGTGGTPGGTGGSRGTDRTPVYHVHQLALNNKSPCIMSISWHSTTSP
jgi:hypothetical protein